MTRDIARFIVLAFLARAGILSWIEVRRLQLHWFGRVTEETVQEAIDGVFECANQYSILPIS